MTEKAYPDRSSCFGRICCCDLSMGKSNCEDVKKGHSHSVLNNELCVKYLVSFKYVCDGAIPQRISIQIDTDIIRYGFAHTYLNFP